jgi:2-polyprenyl-3-methyl-5-hydroxy-6-metoxy-1,4-benzoquinol methylase
MRLTPAECVAVLERTDEELFARGLPELRRASTTTTTFAEDGFWPEGMAEDILSGTTQELTDLHWALERHYAGLIRSHAGATEKEDFYLFIAYARVVGIRMAYAHDMGFTPEEMSFTLGALDAYRGSRPLSDLDLLEVGCGAASLLAQLAERGLRSIRGIDLSAAAIREAKARLAPFGLDGGITAGTLEELAAAEEKQDFDAVIMCDVLEHIPPSRAVPFLRDVHSLLRPGGVLVLVTPNALSGPHDMTRDYHPDSVEPIGFHLREFRLREISRFMTEAGFVDQRAGWRASAPGYSGSDLARAEIRLGSATAPLDLSSLRSTPVSRGAVRTKLALEPLIARLPRRLRESLIEGLYYKGISARRS